MFVCLSCAFFMLSAPRYLFIFDNRFNCEVTVQAYVLNDNFYIRRARRESLSTKKVISKIHY